jgi:uncharacterized protein (DUF885 family)
MYRILILILLSGVLPPEIQEIPAQEEEASERLRALFADHWEWTLREYPLFATQVGDHRYDDRLSSVTEQDQLRRLAAGRGFLERLHTIARASLSPQEQVSYDIFRRLREDDIAESEHRSYLMPITNRSGFHVSFAQLAERVPLATEENYENYISRLRAFRQLVEGYVGLMRSGIRQGDPTASQLYEPFRSFPSTVDQAARNGLTAAGTDAIETSVVPGYREFLRFMGEEYVPAAREEIAASSLPQGRWFYEHRVRRFTTLPLSPRQVHETGLSEVARIRAEMEEIILGSGFEASFQEFVEFLRTDEQFYVESPDELLRRTAFVLKKMDGELPRLFKTLPRMPYGVKPIPDYIAPKTTTAYYNRPAGDGTRAGFYYLNTYDLPSRPTYEIEALSLHEAVPGHHLQIALQQELEDLPEFRRFAGFTAFVEGWALYAERLGLEVGFYEDPYSDFGRLTYEMWRALRLVVDTGMHHFGWSRQRAIDFMAENSALSLHNITNEVDRYIAWPGQALAYKTGELKIRELRELAEQELGTGFDVREFHHVVLSSGAVPLDVLEASVRAWIEASR